VLHEVLCRMDQVLKNAWLAEVIPALPSDRSTNLTILYQALQPILWKDDKIGSFCCDPFDHLSRSLQIAFQYGKDVILWDLFGSRSGGCLSDADTKASHCRVWILF
jgi:hypothetical protein